MQSRKHTKLFKSRKCRNYRSTIRSLILNLILIACMFHPIKAQIYDGFLYWLTNIPSANEVSWSGYARVDGRMYCTDGFYLWDFNAYVWNQTTCPNGAFLHNSVELNGYLADSSCETIADSSDQETFQWVMLTVVPGAIWCGNYTNVGPRSPWEQVFTYENCTPSGGGDCDDQLPPVGGCPERWFYSVEFCRCMPASPIIVDISGNGYNLTSAAGGADFDINGDGLQERLGWTSASSDDAFLVLDRNNNGTIDNGLELFGNFTSQPNNSDQNGFLALAEFDRPANGGNGDGKITNADGVFVDLRFWQDLNHNGVSESSELYTVHLLGVARFDLDYRESRRVDQHGNQFKYRARVLDVRGAQVGRWAWDVFLVSQ